MTFYLFLPLITGISIILQAGFNRQVSMQVGLLTTVLINAIVFLIASVAIWFVVFKGWVQVPALFQITPFTRMEPLFYLPGILGFFIVICMPFALQNMSASVAFGLAIATQMVMSVVWDYLTLGAWPTLQKIFGMILLFVGSLLMLT